MAGQDLMMAGGCVWASTVVWAGPGDLAGLLLVQAGQARACVGLVRSCDRVLPGVVLPGLVWCVSFVDCRLRTRDNLCLTRINSAGALLG